MTHHIALLAAEDRMAEHFGEDCFRVAGGEVQDF
jgi:hypothetical protein